MYVKHYGIYSMWHMYLLDEIFIIYLGINDINEQLTHTHWTKSFVFNTQYIFVENKWLFVVVMIHNHQILSEFLQQFWDVQIDDKWQFECVLIMNDY